MAKPSEEWMLGYIQGHEDGWNDGQRASRDGASDYERRRFLAKARARLCFEDDVTASLYVDDREIEKRRRGR